MKGHDPCNIIGITYFQSNSTMLVKEDYLLWLPWFI